MRVDLRLRLDLDAPRNALFREPTAEDVILVLAAAAMPLWSTRQRKGHGGADEAG